MGVECLLSIKITTINKKVAREKGVRKTSNIIQASRENETRNRTRESEGGRGDTDTEDNIMGKGEKVQSWERKR